MWLCSPRHFTQSTFVLTKHYHKRAVLRPSLRGQGIIGVQFNDLSKIHGVKLLDTLQKCISIAFAGHDGKRGGDPGKEEGPIHPHRRCHLQVRFDEGFPWILKTMNFQTCFGHSTNFLLTSIYFRVPLLPPCEYINFTPPQAWLNLKHFHHNCSSDRNDFVRQFQSDDATLVALLSITAANSGTAKVGSSDSIEQN